MDLLKFTDTQLAELRQSILNEANRRTCSAVHGHDPLTVIRGNAAAKRALEIAAAGGHSILFVGPARSGKTMLRAVCLELGVAESFEARMCACGQQAAPRAACRCAPRQIEAAVARFPAADISVQVRRPAVHDRECPGTALADMRHRVARSSHFTDETLDSSATDLLQAAIRELPLDLVAVARILHVARTIANLDHQPHVGIAHVAEAINYRAIS